MFLLQTEANNTIFFIRDVFSQSCNDPIVCCATVVPLVGVSCYFLLSSLSETQSIWCSTSSLQVLSPTFILHNTKYVKLCFQPAARVLMCLIEECLWWTQDWLVVITHLPPPATTSPIISRVSAPLWRLTLPAYFHRNKLLKRKHMFQQMYCIQINGKALPSLWVLFILMVLFVFRLNLFKLTIKFYETKSKKFKTDPVTFGRELI